jgi:hypothetical protein
VGHFERARADGIAFQVVAEILGAVGLDLRAATFPGGDPIRDEGHARLIGRFLALLPDTVGRALEVRSRPKGTRERGTCGSDSMVGNGEWRRRPT